MISIGSKTGGFASPPRGGFALTVRGQLILFLVSPQTVCLLSHVAEWRRTRQKSGKTKRAVEAAYLDPEKLELLKQLSAQTRIARSVLVREAINDLLIKYKLLKSPRRKPKAAPGRP